jgi:cytochrome c553
MIKSAHRIVIVISLISGAASYGADAAANWTDHCAKCHGEDGKGQTKMGKKLSLGDLTTAAVQAEFTDEEAIKAMKEGIKDKAGKVAMKPVEGLSEDDMKALVKHVRGLKK